VHGSQAIPAPFQPNLNAPLAVVADKANAKTPIPHDPCLYAMRNVVERFFCEMKDMHRLATRLEKLNRNLLTMLHVWAMRQWSY